MSYSIYLGPSTVLSEWVPAVSRSVQARRVALPGGFHELGPFVTSDFVLGAALVSLVAAASHYAVEKPFLKLKDVVGYRHRILEKRSIRPNS